MAPLRSLAVTVVFLALCQVGRPTCISEIPEPMTIAEQAAQAMIIVHGTVTAHYAVPGVPFTEEAYIAEVDVSCVMKGEALPSRINVTRNGRIGCVETRLVTNRTYITFLKRDPAGQLVPHEVNHESVAFESTAANFQQLLQAVNCSTCCSDGGKEGPDGHGGDGDGDGNGDAGHGGDDDSVDSAGQGGGGGEGFRGVGRVDFGLGNIRPHGGDGNGGSEGRDGYDGDGNGNGSASQGGNGEGVRGVGRVDFGLGNARPHGGDGNGSSEVRDGYDGDGNGNGGAGQGGNGESVRGAGRGGGYGNARPHGGDGNGGKEGRDGYGGDGNGKGGRNSGRNGDGNGSPGHGGNSEGHGGRAGATSVSGSALFIAVLAVMTML